MAGTCREGQSLPRVAMMLLQIRYALLSCLILSGSFCIAQSPGTSHLPSGDNTPLDTVVVQLRWKHHFQFAGYYAAAVKGFYREAGLKAELREGWGNSVAVDEVLKGGADFGVTGPEILYRRLLGDPLVVLAAIFQHSAHALVARRDSGITVPADLIGRKVSWSTKWDPDLQAMFRHEGISLDQLVIIPDKWNFDDFVTGKIDALSCYTTTEVYRLKSLKVPYTMIHPVNYGIDFYGDCLFTSERQIADHRKRVANFRIASLKGWEYAMDHVEEMIDIILRNFGGRDHGLTREQLRFEADAMRRLIFPDLVEMGHMNPERWRRIADTYADVGMVDRSYSLHGFIYEPNPVPDTGWVGWLAGGAAALALLAASVIFLNIRLRQVVQARTRELEGKNATLLQENAERKRVEGALLEVNQILSALVKASPLAIVAIDRAAKITIWNPAAEVIFGWTEREVRDRQAPFVRPEMQEEHIRLRDGVLQGRPYAGIEVIRGRKDGSLVDLLASSAPLYDRHGEVIGAVAMFADITDRKHADEQIKASLKEKEVLLKEIHHRVKNNLQVVSSLLSLQGAYIRDPQDAQLFKESQNRVRSMALVHERLYRSENLAKIDFGEYIHSLTAGLFQTWRGKVGGMTLDVLIADLFLDIDISIPCGLIVNELVTNSLKYAFPDGREGKISVRMECDRDGTLVLEVSDNGVGLPENIDFNKPKSLGFELVGALSYQLGGNVEVARNGGTMFRIRIPRK